MECSLVAPSFHENQEEESQHDIANVAEDVVESAEYAKWSGTEEVVEAQVHIS